MKRLSPPIALAITLALLTGCTGDGAGGETDGAGGMGMGGDLDGGVMNGAVASVENASLDAPGANGQGGYVNVGRVLAPTDGWVVVRSTIAPGGILGKSWVPAGETKDLRIRLEVIDGPAATVSFNVDQGRRKRFEFNPARPVAGIDKPLYVDNKPLAVPINIKPFGVEATPNSALVLAEDQAIKNDVVRVAYTLTPAPTWIVVREFADGLPGRVLGSAWRPAGELQEIDVPLSSSPRTDELIVVLHADRGVTERFEFSAEDPLGAPDQPWVSAGVMVSKRIRLLPQ